MLFFYRCRVALCDGLALARSEVLGQGWPARTPQVCPPQRYDIDTGQSRVPVAWVVASAPCPPASPQWQSRMAALGAQLRARRVDRVVLVHGTFVGSDPLSLGPLLGGLLPKSGWVQDLGKKVVGAVTVAPLAGELGVFTPGYAAACSGALGVPCSPFAWSSANTHLARLKGAWELLVYLAKGAKPFRRTLLFAHSHGGQVASLVLQLLAGTPGAPVLLGVLRDQGVDVSVLGSLRSALKHHFLDIVTLGTPPRYGWVQSPLVGLTHIIHHRGAHRTGAEPTALLQAGQGDMVQQLGIAGSDMLDIHPGERATNVALDSVLGVGYGPKDWAQFTQARVRLHNAGHHVLLDFGEEAPPFKTLFGHGAYTQQEWAPEVFGAYCTHGGMRCVDSL